MNISSEVILDIFEKTLNMRGRKVDFLIEKHGCFFKTSVKIVDYEYTR